MNSKGENRLGNARSPYLQQHRDNPIWWWEWSEEAFAAARRENKPVFLSVGYSTCHWCHVMAHESFEDQEVAEALNSGFISIKLDREERPDIDHVFMSALQALTGGGGWPMSVWLTPDGKPFFAGTYFPRFRFLQVLRRISELWNKESAALSQDGERLWAALKDLERNQPLHVGESLAHDFLKSYVSHFQHVYDDQNGGFGGAPKFPPSMSLMLMMRQDHKIGLRQAEAMVTGTLTHMLRGGVYDQLRGGFHRYSVDEKWLVPHFEKMLYDQAMISVALLDAYLCYGGDKELARAATETLDYVLNEMTDARFGFYSAQDADSLNPATGEKEEGYFCTFSYEELRTTLTEQELDAVARAYGVTPAGQFEGRNILHLQEGTDGTVKQDPLIHSALAKLGTLRAERPAPHLDDKIIVSWNGWMIWALARASGVLHQPKFLASARRALDFILGHLWRDEVLYRYWRDGQTKARATAEDYASLIHAMIEIQQADPYGRWPEMILRLQKKMDELFWSEADGVYFANDGSDKLLAMRPREAYDGVHPCSNSMAVYNLYRLYALTGEAAYKQKAERVVGALFNRLKDYPSSLPFLGLGMDFGLSRPKAAVLAGDGWTREFYNAERGNFHPYILWAKADDGWPVSAGKSGEKSAIYVCEEGRCLAPALRAADVVLDSK